MSRATEIEGAARAYNCAFNDGIQAACERARTMANSLPEEPVTQGARVMRDTALDIADSILDLKKPIPT